MERGCVRSTSRSTLKSFEASDAFQQASPSSLLRLVFDTAALRGQRAAYARLIFPVTSGRDLTTHARYDDNHNVRRRHEQ